MSVTGCAVGCGGGRICGAAVLGIWNQRQENRGENSGERLGKWKERAVAGLGGVAVPSVAL